MNIRQNKPSQSNWHNKKYVVKQVEIFDFRFSILGNNQLEIIQITEK